MRIIDADILERSLTEIDEHINMDIFTNEVRELIDNAPTVKAIPIDRIQQLHDDLKSKADEYEKLDIGVSCGIMKTVVELNKLMLEVEQ